ncbi:iron complex transport system substrate-binding protein [Halanaerobium saccharolyticum]|uniref:Iron complex transport system substrate-binding protein n=1 Tax=Halanaerobium saccharolyticum TaxID=43595 RepID=A0A4R6SIV6_9FIRM|nr:cobalamin-binding protein [Halanaerobium saccharolyticum]TDQ01613.1 iron complex transport system substrate-binding protein [Halanaerobium saccharolyticum]
MKNIKFSLFLLILLIFAAAIPISAQEFPLNYTDELGRDITINKEVERIITLAPGMTEVIYALGLEDKLVAVSSACDYPSEALQKEDVGRIDEPNIEKIVALEPDLVIAESVTPIESLERLTELGIKNIGFKPVSINDTINMIEEIAYLTSAEEAGTELSSKMKVNYQHLRALVKGKLKNNDRKRVFYEIWSDPLYTAGQGTFIDSLIQDAGGYNIGREAEGSWPTYSLESLIAADPEVYISSAHSAPDGLTLEDLRGRELFREISAFKNNRLYLVDQNLVNRPSPRIIEGYKQFIQAIFPELKEEIN